MATASPQRDPRSIVTPDAFELSNALLGTPLAAPGRRLAALLIDLVVIGVLTVVTRSFALVLGVVAAVFFMRAGFRRTPVEGSVFGRAMRLSVGCLGFAIAIVTAVVWASFGVGFDGDSDGDVPSISGAIESSGAAEGVVAALAMLSISEAFEDVETLDEAEVVTREMAGVASEVGVAPADLRDMLERAVPDDAEWADGAGAMFDRLLAVSQGEDDDAPEGSSDGEEPTATVAGYTLDEALVAYADVVRADSADEGLEPLRDALRTRLAGEIATDTLSALAERIDDLEATNRRQGDRLARAEEALTEATSGGLFNWMREFVDELGFGFGWASLYLTVMLTWWNGQTIGKRLLGLRVLRLDGKPITWWVAFERAGGYAAGFATGLLGFAQVYWDANRQAIHDRIVGTVVVRDDAERIGDWESAL